MARSVARPPVFDKDWIQPDLPPRVCALINCFSTSVKCWLQHLIIALFGASSERHFLIRIKNRHDFSAAIAQCADYYHSSGPGKNPTYTVGHLFRAEIVRSYYGTSGDESLALLLQSHIVARVFVGLDLFSPTPADSTSDEPANELPGEGTTVRMARATWDTGWFQAEVFALLLERLGYTVEAPTTMDNLECYEAIANGDITMWPNGWFPLHNSFIDAQESQEQIVPVGFEVQAGALQGYLIDKATAEAMDITNLEDFTRPEVIAAFDHNDNGKADLIGCDEGWGCGDIIEYHLDAYDLRESVEHIRGNYSELIAETITRYEAGKPILFYTWTPNWTVGMLVPGDDVVWLEVPFASLPDEQKDQEEFTTVIGLTGCVSDPCNMGYPPNDIRVVANKDFLDAHPAAHKLFELVEIPLGDISAQNALMHEGEDSEEDLRRHAEDWASQNRELVNQWLEQARQAP